tara:strand:- start:85 stop:261 length:177 start_codon:yes stop_codon:yes gene_type:complete
VHEDCKHFEEITMSHLKDLIKKNMIAEYIEKAQDLSSWNIDYINFFNENCEAIFNTFY